ncbi:hypothetical protein LCGC14_1075280 [marine sediment metagenome]|uniref:Uncharacterized protein n=1 Tax=marine sediment metagenome TaxID=412755 RepID=A0A0F9MLN4_9ZZZZ
MVQQGDLGADILKSLQVGPQIVGTGAPPLATQPGGLTGFFSIVDGHELTKGELEASNLVLGGDGFVYQPVLGEGPFAGDIQGFELAPKWLQEEVLGLGGGPGTSGPTAAELAIQRSQVQAQNLATFIQGTVAELETEIDTKRLSTEQALDEFNKRLDAFAEAGEQFVGIQPFTIAPGSKFFPGRGPGDIGEALGRPTLEASPIDFDPFGMANQIVAESPNLTDIGVPSGAALDEAIAIARGFLGG